MALEVGKWYAVRARHGRESSCSLWLERLGYEVFMPFGRPHGCHGRTRVAVRPAMFPGYVFCKYTVDALARIVQAPGAIEIVSVAGAPVPVDDRELDSIRRIAAAGVSYEFWNRPIVGSHVRIMQGPLKMVEGRYVGDVGTVMVIVEITLLRRAVSVRVPAAWVRERNQ